MGVNKLCGSPWGMGFEQIDGLAIERMMGIRHIKGVLCLCLEISAVNSIRALRAKAPQELQPLKVGLIGIERGFEQKLLSAPRRAQKNNGSKTGPIPMRPK